MFRVWLLAISSALLLENVSLLPIVTRVICTRPISGSRRPYPKSWLWAISVPSHVGRGHRAAEGLGAFGCCNSVYAAIRFSLFAFNELYPRRFSIDRENYAQPILTYLDKLGFAELGNPSSGNVSCRTRFVCTH